MESALRSHVGAGCLTRGKISKVMGISPYELTQRLKASGLTFAGLVNLIRLELAQTLLLKERPINQIVVDLCFADASAFTRAFKKWAGTTPARWRRAYRLGLNFRLPLS